ncbi:MAG: hypothetical protein IPJ19_17550 [Planctomycetes bacterium]|nr:hypothetical protein [Planctomycetota bacterium]
MTDADGRFDVANSSWSMQRLSVTALGYAQTFVVAQPGHETPEKVSASSSSARARSWASCREAARR